MSEGTVVFANLDLAFMSFKIYSLDTQPHFTKKNSAKEELHGNQILSAREIWWTGRDLNPRPPRCQRGDRASLIYPPVCE